MEKLSTIIFGIILILLYLPLSAQENPYQVATTPLTLEQVKEDFAILKGALTTDYPSAGRYISQDSVNALWAKWETQLRPMNERELFSLMGEITHSFHDEHLIPNASRDFLRNPNRCFLPFTVEVEQENMWASAVHPSAQHLSKGDKILAINGHDAGRVIREISRKLHHDGYISTFIERHLEDFSPTQSFNYFDMWYAVLYEDSLAQFELKVVQGSDTLNLSVDALSRKEYLEFYWSRMPREAPAKFEILQDSVGYLAVSSFHGWYRKQYKQNFKQFFAQSFQSLRKQQISTLILDFRYCEGGDDSNKLLLQYLIHRPFTVTRDMFTTFSGQPKYRDYYDNPALKIKPSLLKKYNENWYGIREQAKKKIPGLTPLPPKKYAFTGKLMVLTSGATGSAAAVASALIKSHTDALFIGEETGGTTDGPTALIVPSLILPNSKIRIEVPWVQTHLEVKGTHGRGVIPDIPLSNREYAGSKMLEYVLDLRE